jgi:hypothetical protein
MWLIYKRGGDRSDEVRMNRWRNDFYLAGGKHLETSGVE